MTSYAAGLLADIILVSPVISVAITAAGPRIPAIQNCAKHARPIFRETLNGKSRALGCRLPGTDHQDYTVSQAAKHARVRQVDHRRRIDHYHVILTAQTR